MQAALPDRSNLPEHLKKVRLPPAWTDLQFNPDPEANLMAIGKDSKGRDQYVYNSKFVQANQAAKFARTREAERKFDSMVEQTVKDQRSRDPVKREHALVAELVFRTGIRPGSDDDTGASKRAFGATTLEVRHVVPLKRGVRLRFTGKKGVSLDIPVPDGSLADELVRRKESATDSKAKLFDVTDNSLRDYVKTLDGGDFKTKDIRTALGSKLAREHVASVKKPPSNEKEYKAVVREVAKRVASVLGNTPAVCLSAYIDPSTFTDWRVSAGV